MLHLLQRAASNPSQNLTVTEPTPSSVCYTVSTRPPQDTVTAYGRHYARLVLRVVVGCLTLVALVAKWDLESGKQWILRGDAGGEGEARLLAHVLQQWPWRNVVVCVVVILWLILRRGYTGMFVLSFLQLMVLANDFV